MPQSLVKNLIHLVYSTKHRKPLILQEFQDGLYAYQAGIFEQWESPAVIIGGVEDYRECRHRPQGRRIGSLVSLGSGQKTRPPIGCWPIRDGEPADVTCEPHVVGLQ